MWTSGGAVLTGPLCKEFAVIGCGRGRVEGCVVEISHHTPFMFVEEAVEGPSDLIMTRGNMEEEEAEDSDTDDIDHTGETFPLIGTCVYVSHQNIVRSELSKDM